MNTKPTEITQIYERNQEATLYVGGLDIQVDEELLWELFLQCGPIRNVHIPRDKITASHLGFGFVEFESELDSDYAIKIMNLIKLYGKPIRCSKASHDRRTQEIGANVFVGNLENDVDEKLLFDTFSAFGTVISTKVMRDPDTGISKGFGFVSYDSFDASDSCLAAMNGQFLCNRPIHVSYAYKKDTKGERHGSAAERLIAANRPADKLKPHLNFATNLPLPVAGFPPVSVIPGVKNNIGGYPMMPPSPAGLMFPPSPSFDKTNVYTQQTTQNNTQNDNNMMLNTFQPPPPMQKWNNSNPFLINPPMFPFPNDPSMGNRVRQDVPQNLHPNFPPPPPMLFAPRLGSNMPPMMPMPTIPMNQNQQN